MKHLIIIFLCSLFISSAGQTENQLPKPSGKYLTGVSYMSLTDKNRKELFDNSRESNRELTVKFWYPADVKTEVELYLENPDLIVDNFPFSEAYRTLKTNSCKNVPASNTEGKFPILIFSHGWGEHFSQNTILMEELASHGYIVFSLAHHYECKFTFYPDGRILALDTESRRFQQIMQEQQNPQAMEVFGKMNSAFSDKEQLDVFIQTNKIIPTLLIEGPKYWADDIDFFIDELNNINTSNNILKDKLDLTKIGVFGMSMGGIASGEVCIANEKVKAGASLDGGLYGSLTDNQINTPFLFINSQRYLAYGNLFVGKSNNDCFSITIPDSDHYNLTDYGIFPALNQAMLGTIAPALPIEIINKSVLAFFDLYLKNIQGINLSEIVGDYNVEFVKN